MLNIEGTLNIGRFRHINSNFNDLNWNIIHFIMKPEITIAILSISDKKFVDTESKTK